MLKTYKITLLYTYSTCTIIYNISKLNLKETTMANITDVANSMYYYNKNINNKNIREYYCKFNIEDLYDKKDPNAVLKKVTSIIDKLNNKSNTINEASKIVEKYIKNKIKDKHNIEIDVTLTLSSISEAGNTIRFESFAFKDYDGIPFIINSPQLWIFNGDSIKEYKPEKIRKSKNLVMSTIERFGVELKYEPILIKWIAKEMVISGNLATEYEIEKKHLSMGGNKRLKYSAKGVNKIPLIQDLIKSEAKINVTKKNMDDYLTKYINTEIKKEIKKHFNVDLKESSHLINYSESGKTARFSNIQFEHNNTTYEIPDIELWVFDDASFTKSSLEQIKNKNINSHIKPKESFQSIFKKYKNR
jgi:hypothetical protein